jgi:phosphate transport system permease protein
LPEVADSKSALMSTRAERRGLRSRFSGDRLFQMLTLAPALIVLGLLIGITVVLIWSARESIIKFGFQFVFSSDWDPANDHFGALPFIYGTAVSSAIALLMAVPLSLGVALCLSEVVPGWLASRLAFLVELLAAIPSVVYGLWGIFVLGPFLSTRIEPILARYLGFIPLFQGPRVSVSMLSAGVILAVMVIPFISAVSIDVFSAVPGSQREAALALGATRWEMVRIAVLPYGFMGIIGAVLLGLGRALGETIAVAMVIGNRPAISASLCMPASTLASVIANEFAEATSDVYVSALLELGLVLLVLGMLANMIARLLVLRTTRRMAAAGGR